MGKGLVKHWASSAQISPGSQPRAHQAAEGNQDGLAAPGFEPQGLHAAFLLLMAGQIQVSFTLNEMCAELVPLGTVR